MKQNKILFMGAPGTGKSALLHFLEQKGHYCFPEISREIILKARQKGNEQPFLENPLLFSELLLKERIRQFETAENLVEKTVFFDRGIPDITAYLEYGKHPCPDFFYKANQNYRYDRVFMFPLWKAIYGTDNERYESYAQAAEIEKNLERTYWDLGYRPIKIPKTSLENRAEFILEELHAA